MNANDRPDRFRTPAVFWAKQTLRKVLRHLTGPRLVQRDRILLVEELGGCENPIFLIGFYRSGTTLMRRVVDSHSRIACPPETFFLIPLVRLLEEGRFQDGLQSMGFDRQAVARGLRRTASYYYDAYCRSKGKERWADKTPEYLRILPFIQDIFGPTCQYLMIYRHPLDVLNSLLASGWDFSSEEWASIRYDDNQFMNFLLYHADMLQRQLDFEAEHQDRCFRIFYEELVVRPEEILRPMFDFLGEPWEKDVLAHHEKQHDSGFEDPNASVIRGFRPSVGNWKRWPPRQVELARKKLARQLEQLGYDS